MKILKIMIFYIKSLIKIYKKKLTHDIVTPFTLNLAFPLIRFKIDNTIVTIYTFFLNTKMNEFVVDRSEYEIMID